MRRPAFTLIELAIALGMIAILAASVTPTVTGWIDARRVRATVEQLSDLRDALQRHRADTGAWPGTLAALRGRYLPPQAPLTSPWGAPFELATGAPAAVVSVRIPVPLPATTYGMAITAAPSGGSTTLSVHIPPSGAASDLEVERCRLTGVCS